MRSPTLAAIFFSTAAAAQFSPPRPIETTEIAFMTVASIADINGDGANDVVAAGQANLDELYMYLNDGVGNFSEAILIDGTSYIDFAIEVVTGDVDGDGDVDVIGIENYTRAFLHRNLGNAQFAPAMEIIAALGDIRAKELVDVDGDGDNDLLVIDYWEDAIQWYPNDGNGVFGAAQVISNSLSGITAFAWARADADADADLVVLQYTGQASLFLNLGGGVFGTLQPITDVGGNSYSIELADLDGDGDNDLLGGSDFPVGVFWYPNNGAGLFGAQQLLTNDLYSWSVTNVADMDDDGDLDVVPGSGVTPYWLENDGAGNFPAQHPISEAEAGEARLADMDADGDVDVVSVWGRVSYLPNDGVGNMGLRRMVNSMVQNVSTVRLVDIDGDGDLDVASNDQGNSDKAVFYRNDGTGDFGPQEVIVDTVPMPDDMEFADLDGDGDQDLVLHAYYTLQTFTNDGNGVFQPGAMLISAYATYIPAVVADFDGDGAIDIACASYGEEMVRVWLNDGSGGFGAPTMFILSQPDCLRSADVDGDGDIDLVLHSLGQLNLYWYENDGSATFAQHLLAPSFTTFEDERFLCVDIDGNTTPDVVFSDGEFIMWYSNNGDGTFQSPNVIALWEDSWPVLNAADVDGDGDNDMLLLPQDGGTFSWMPNNGTLPFLIEEMIDVAVNGTPQYAGVGDLDGDGQNDVVLAHGNGNDSYGIDWYESFISSIYHLQGNVFHDTDEDGVQDNGETGLPFVMAMATPIASMPLTDASGDYDISADIGTYTVQPVLPNAWWGITTTPQTYTVTLDAITPVSTGNDFGIAPVVDTTLLVLGINASTAPCFGANMQMLSITNLGTTQPSGTICYTLDTAFTFTASTPPPTSINGNQICWDLDSLYYFSQTTIVIDVLNPGTTALGDTVNCTLTVDAVDGTGNALGTYTSTFTTVVTCAFDPNDKQVMPAGYGDVGAVDIGTEFLDYRIRFQNTGNATATDVVLRDQLSTDLNWSTLQVVGHSHPPTSIVVNEIGQLEVHFDNIQLPDSGASFTASQGYFSYRIKLVEGLPHGTVVHNTANIHFDLNPPVVTNTTLTTLVDCELATAGISLLNFQALSATQGDTYQWFMDGEPVPGATGQVHFFLANGSYTCEVTTALGCVVMTDPYNVTTVSIEEEEHLHMALIPNPMTSSARLVLSEPLQTGDAIEVVDINGQVVAIVSVNGGPSVTIDRGALAEGIYLVRAVRSGTTLASMRMVVMDR